MSRITTTTTVLLTASALAIAAPKRVPDLLLISWKQSDGQWVFRVIPDNRWTKSTHNQILEFAAMTKEYERGIPWPDAADTLQLYADTPQRIIWVEYVGTDLRYPPRDIVSKVKTYAVTHKIRLSFDRVKR